jgi:hypothetical protein
VASGDLGTVAEEEALVTEPVELHRRTIDVDLTPAAGGGVSVRGELLDERRFSMGSFLGKTHGPGVVHHMTLALELDAGRTVTAAGADMKTSPFPTPERTRGEACPQVLPRYASLVGETIDEGFAARLIERFGGPLGCFHVLALAQCVPFALRALGAGPARRSIVVRSLVPADVPLALDGEIVDSSTGGERRVGLRLDLELPSYRIARAVGRGGDEARLGALTGLAIARGFTGAAIERLGGDDDGLALVVAMTPVTAQAGGILAVYRGVDPRSRPRAGSGPIGSCHMWRPDGPLVELTTTAGGDRREGG